MPVRQWMLSAPKRLRYFMQRDGEALIMVLRIFLRVIAQSLSAKCPGTENWTSRLLPVVAVSYRCLWKDLHKQRKPTFTTLGR
jgi:hypothetical protein